MKKTKKYIPLIAGILLTVSALSAGIFLPGIIINKKNQSKLNTVTSASKEYYLASDSLLAKNLSNMLSNGDRIKIACNAWESTERIADKSEANLTEYEAVQIAKSQMEYFYNKKIYPYSFASSFDNWYSWNTELYCYVDATFNTYSAYIWKITLTRYDNQLTHTIFMTEDGTILNAYVNEMPEDYEPIRYAYTATDLSETLHDRDASYDSSVHFYSIKLSEIRYPEDSLADATLLDAYDLTVNYKGQDPTDFVIYQYTNNENGYGIGIIAK